jgi:hypothetical protein
MSNESHSEQHQSTSNSPYAWLLARQRRQAQVSRDFVCNTKAAAVMLDVHPATLRRWIAQGVLPAFRAGKRGWLRITLGAIERLRNDRNCEPLKELTE